jgi:hypothetical protein
MPSQGIDIQMASLPGGLDGVDHECDERTMVTDQRDDGRPSAGRTPVSLLTECTATRPARRLVRRSAREKRRRAD